jgi:uncharacterized protein YecE (DUF72 family)
MTGRIHIGTSGWSYEHWSGPFYPPELTSDDRLPFYAQRLHAAEINNSFYHLPKRETFQRWRERTPEGFVFAVKGSRYITHMKKLKDPAESIGNFMEAVTGLGDKLGPILFQLPPRWRSNPQRLEAFLTSLPPDHTYAFEFRDESWFVDDVYEALRRHNAAFCIYELAGRRSPTEVTSDTVYLRLHGPEDAYEGSYSTQALAGWAGAVSSWSRQGKTVHCYFDNDQNGYAAQNALQLASMLDA